MTINADDINKIVETVKKFLHDLITPNMTIEKIAEVASPKLDEVIKKNAEKGLKYSAGKFKIKYVDDKHFALEFEMYFKDDAGKWYKAANESEPRDAELIDPASWKTLTALKVVEFPIGSPNEENITDAAEVKSISAADESPKSSTTDKKEITLEKLMGVKE
ncbi:MAG: hypothetical protein IJ728_08470 [Selenomonadaceae bacterium]|nr:hypothetical protein [Selenomonadaceae bacterium]